MSLKIVRFFSMMNKKGAMGNMRCWMDGKIVEVENLNVLPISHGTLHGVNYTETFRVYKGRPVFLQDYYARLCEQLKMYNITMPYTITELEEAIAQVNSLWNEDSIFYIHITSTEPNVFQFVQDYSALRIIILQQRVAPIYFYKEKEAFWLQTPYKSESPSTRIRASLEVHNFERYEGFFINEQGIITEGITSIIFWVKDDILYTPSLHIGINPTVPRQLIIQLAIKMGYQVQEGAYMKYELEQAYECFIVNSLEEIVPINRIGDITFAGHDGLVYERLFHAYGHEILKQLRRD